MAEIYKTWKAARDETSYCLVILLVEAEELDQMGGDGDVGGSVCFPACRRERG